MVGEELQRVCACLTPSACGDVCVICVCLQERGRADGSIDHREYDNHVESKEHFSKHTLPLPPLHQHNAVSQGAFKKESPHLGNTT